jgi:hypothetical protein
MRSNALKKRMKSISLSTLLFLCFISGTFGQSNKLHFEAAVYPNMSSGIVTNDGSVPGGVEAGYSSSEIAKPSISATILTGYSLGKRLQFVAGLGYQNNGERTQKYELVFTNPDPAYSSMKHIRFRYNHHNIEIPLLLRFYFSKRFYGIAGTSAIFNLYNTSGSTKVYNNNKRDRENQEDNTTDFRTFNFSANLGFGFDCIQKEHFTWFVQPYFQYGILGISKDASLNRHFLSGGIVTGVRLPNLPFHKKGVVNEGV